MAQRLRFGIKRFLIWLVKTDGSCGGILGDAIADGQISGAYVGKYPKSAGLSTVSAEVATQTGGGVRIGQVITGDRPMAAFAMTAADLDTALWALTTGSVEESTNSLMHRYSSNPANTDPPICGFAIQEQFFDPSRASGAQKYWITTIMPYCTIEPQHTESTENAFVAVNYQITPNYTTKEHTGRSFSDAAGMFLTDGMTDWYAIPTTSPIHIAAAKAEGTLAQTLTLPYKPVSSVVTINATLNEVYREGVTEAATSVSTSTSEIVLAAGADSDDFVITYATDYIASS